MKTRNWLMLIWLGLIVALVACSAPSKPTVRLASISGQITEGQEITLPVTATDGKGVVRIEFLVDNKFVTEAPINPPAKDVSVPVKWVAVAGQHTIGARSFNSDNVASEMDTMYVSVTSAPMPGPLPVPTAAPNQPTKVPPTPTAGPTGCTNDAKFVADVTVPDGTQFQPNQAFNKIWRVQNIGSCMWSTKYQIFLLSGERMTTMTQIAVAASVAPGQTTDLVAAMGAPAAPGVHAGSWQLRDEAGAFFGPTLVVKINTVAPIAPPNAVMVSPANGFRFTAGAPIRITYQGNGNTELSSVALYINGAQVAKQTSRTPSRQITGYFDWSPAAGNYDVYAMATDIQGQQGNSAHVSGTIAAPAPCQAAINFRADRTTINYNEHTVLRWDVECVKAVYLNGQGVAGHDARDVSPNATTTYTLRVTKNDNTNEDRQVTITVNAQPQPTQVPQPTRRNITGSYVAGEWNLTLNEAVGCSGSDCGFAGELTHAVLPMPTTHSVQGTLGVYSGSVSFSITMPGGASFTGTLSSDSRTLSGTLSGTGALTFKRQ